MSRLRRVAPVLPVQEIGPSIAHYERLGFTASPYESTDGGAPVYCFLSSGDVELHLTRVRTLDVHANTSACYIYVEDAQALHAAWTASGAGGHFTAPADTPRHANTRRSSHSSTMRTMTASATAASSTISASRRSE